MRMIVNWKFRDSETTVLEMQLYLHDINLLA